MSDVNAALQGKGLSKVDMSANPDLILLVSGGLKQQTSYSAWGMRGIGGGMGGITPEQNVEGTLIVSLYDAKQKIAGLARDRPGYLEQQRQQKPAAAGKRSPRCLSSGQRAK